jgi:hypothetical protein
MPATRQRQRCCLIAPLDGVARLHDRSSWAVSRTAPLEKSVAIAPDVMALTRMPRSPSSFAKGFNTDKQGGRSTATRVDGAR